MFDWPLELLVWHNMHDLWSTAMDLGERGFTVDASSSLKSLLNRRLWDCTITTTYHISFEAILTKHLATEPSYPSGYVLKGKVVKDLWLINFYNKNYLYKLQTCLYPLPERLPFFCSESSECPQWDQQICAETGLWNITMFFILRG